MKIKDLISKIDDRSFEQVLELLIKMAQEKDKKAFVVTINPEIVMLGQRDPHYVEVLGSADLALADGIGIVWAGSMFGRRFKGRSHGTDIVEKFSQRVSKKPITVGFLGGKQNVAELTANCLREKYPGLKVAFALEEWPKDKSKIKNQISKMSRTTSRGEIINHKSSIINQGLSCDMLFVALGSPKQEIWISENLHKIDTRVAIGVGGAFDFISGRVPRAPVFIRKMGLEWLFRLIIQPWRAKRQVALIKFVIAVLREKFR